MECRARLTDISLTVERKTRVTFQIEASPEAAAELANQDIRLTAVRWRSKRSLDANAYFHVLCAKIALATNQSLSEAKNRLISEYGRPETTDDGRIMTVILRDDIEAERLATLHLRPTAAVRVLDDGKLYRVHWVMRGSHTYDTKEMSVLIDGTVREAQELGIETLTPDTLERMKAAWKAS